MPALRLRAAVLLLSVSLAPAACGDDPVFPARSRLVFSPSEVELGTGRSATLNLINRGQETVRNVRVVAEPVRQGSARIETISLEVEPELVDEIAPDETAVVTVTLTVVPGTPQGRYRTGISLRVDEREVTDAELTLEVEEIRDLSFIPDEPELGGQREFQLVLKNTGSTPLVEGANLYLSEVERTDGGISPWEVDLQPTSTGPLFAGDSVILQGRLERGEARFDPGAFQFAVTALSPAGLQRRITVRFRVLEPDTIEVDAPETARRGEGFAFQIVPKNESGEVNDEVILRTGVAPELAGYLDPDLGMGVGYRAGEVELSVRAGSYVRTHPVSVEPRENAGGVSLLAEARVCTERSFGSLATHRGHAYVGSYRFRSDPFAFYDVGLMIFDVSNPSDPVLADSLPLDAWLVSDLDVLEGRDLAAISLSASDQQAGGIVLADLSSPTEPRIVSRFSEALEDGVVRTDPAGDILYVGDRSGDLNIVDVSDPAAPSLLATLGGEGSPMRLWEDGGVLFLEEGDSTLTIFDVGGGGAGGAPATPVQVGRIVLSGQTLLAGGAGRYDPDRRRLYLTTLQFGGEVRNRTEIRTYDLSDPASPVLLAWAPVETDDNVVYTPGDLLLDDTGDRLHIPWGDQGYVVLDVSGDPFGDVLLGGREVGRSLYNGAAGGCGGSRTLAGEVVLEQGVAHVVDGSSGLVTFQVF